MIRDILRPIHWRDWDDTPSSPPWKRDPGGPPVTTVQPSTPFRTPKLDPGLPPPVPLFLRSKDWSDRTVCSRPLRPFSPLPPPEEKDLELLGDFFLPKLMAMLFKLFQGLVEGVESPVHMLEALPVFGQEGEGEGPVENGKEKLLEESGGKFPGGERDEGRIGGSSILWLPIPCQGMEDPDPLREIMAPMVDEDPVKG